MHSKRISVKALFYKLALSHHVGAEFQIKCDGEARQNVGYLGLRIICFTVIYTVVIVLLLN